MQVVDFSLLSLAQFNEKCGFANVGENRRRVRRDVTDAMRAMYWYHGVSRATGIDSAYRLERWAEPEAFKVLATGAQARRNKWPSYRAGRRVPSQALVDRVETMHPGLSADLNCVLWKALSAKVLSAKAIDALVLQLDLQVQGVVRRRGLRYPSSKYVHGAIDQRLADTLERHACLDALAAIVLMLRRAHLLGHRAAAYVWGRQAYRMLLMLGPQLYDRGIVTPLLGLMQERIFPLATLSGVGYWLSPEDFLKAAGGLQSVLDSVSGVSANPMSEKERLDYMRRLMGGQLGWDCRYAFNPIRVEVGMQAEDPQVSDSKTEAQWTQRDRWCQEWAWNMLKSGGHPEPPPTAVRLHGDVWAKAKPESTTSAAVSEDE